MLQWNWPGLAWHGWPTPPRSAGASSTSGRNGKSCACARGSLIIDHLDGLCIPLVYCAATVVPAQKPIGAKLSAIGLNYIVLVLSGTRRLMPRECMRECDILSCISEPKQNRTRAWREWNKYKYYQNISGLNPPVASQQAGNGPPIAIMRAIRSDSSHAGPAGRRDRGSQSSHSITHSLTQSASQSACLSVSASCLGWPLFHRTTPTQPRLTIFETKAPMPVPNHQLTTPLGRTVGFMPSYHPMSGQLASNERAGHQRETRGPRGPATPAYVIGHAQGATREAPIRDWACPLVRPGLSQSATRAASFPGRDLARPLAEGAVPATGPATSVAIAESYQ
jgi:hypothetical protein